MEKIELKHQHPVSSVRISIRLEEAGLLLSVSCLHSDYGFLSRRDDPQGEQHL